MTKIYSNKWTVSVSSGGGGGSGLPAKFNINPQLTVSMPIAMIYDIVGLLNCYYVSDYFSSNPCCGSKPSGYAFTLNGEIQDSVGNPVPNTQYEIYLLTPDTNLRVIDYVTGTSMINPTQSNPLMAKSDANGNMNLGFVYYGYPSPDKNSNDYPTLGLFTHCVEGNIVPSLAVTDTVQYNIPNTAITANTIITITWYKHYITMGTPCCSCPNQTNQCF